MEHGVIKYLWGRFNTLSLVLLGWGLLILLMFLGFLILLMVSGHNQFGEEGDVPGDVPEGGALRW